jgi:hypothetical protein
MVEMKDEELRALRLLARHPNGYAQVAFRGYGLKRAVLASLIEDGLATMTSRDTHQQRLAVPVAWITNTAAGRKAITE